jgi:hypothetical protein
LHLEDKLSLSPLTTSGARVEALRPGAWRLEIPPGPAGQYRLAQLDDYGKISRRDFPWQAPLRLALRARAASPSIPGTWGLGLWNDPFSMALARGLDLRLPALPNAAWFFFASPPNYLSLRDDLPAQGPLAMVFRAPRWPPAVLALGAPALPLLLWRPAARLLRRLGRRFVRQDSAALASDPAEWHAYELDWQPGRVTFRVDGDPVLESQIAPRGPLGLVLWVDNQYATLAPDGRAGFGNLAHDRPEWIELEDVRLATGEG